MTGAGEQNHLDLQALVDEINRCFAEGISFVYLPGDVADDGSAAAYGVVRGQLDRLQAPWCAIIGDHDVHEKRFNNYLDAMAEATHYAFTVGTVRFLAMNAFDDPDPGAFCVLDGQMAWAENEVRIAAERGQTVVLLLHCYPSDLKRGAQRVHALTEAPHVRLIDMGHTHYNEVSNDGRALYTATRSTGQIEEGPVGFSVTNIDRGIVSWRFFELDLLPAVMILSPADERFVTEAEQIEASVKGTPVIRAKAWSDHRIERVEFAMAGLSGTMQRVKESSVWQAEWQGESLPDGVYALTVRVLDALERRAEDAIRAVVGASPGEPPRRATRDQDNALPAWPERGLLGTQLGPNKNGRKW
jgi:Icc protein